MALWGKGDPRWIVEERPDSTNVNNWHWTERDATNWSKEKLKALFTSLEEGTEEGNWKIDEVKKVEGEATLNNRKGKLIVFYEWDIKLTYKGRLSGSELDHSGNIHIPNLSDENDASDIDVEITSKGDSKNAEILKNIVRKNGIKLCREKCQQYLDDLKTEYSTGMVLPTKSDSKKNGNSNVPNGKVNQNMKNLNMNDITNNKENSKKSAVHVSLQLSEEFRTNAEELFACLTRPERLTAFTRSECKSELVINGNFSLMDGNITGSYLEIIPNKKIVQKWRFKEWPKDLYSTVTMILDDKSDRTLLRLSQTGVPDYDIRKTEEGWKQHFWGPMKQVFGFGAQLF